MARFALAKTTEFTNEHGEPLNFEVRDYKIVGSHQGAILVELTGFLVSASIDGDSKTVVVYAGNRQPTEGGKQ